MTYLVETNHLISLKVTEVILAFKTQKEVWLPNSHCDRATIGKFTQGRKAGGKRLRRSLVTDQRELDYLVRDTRQSGTLVGVPKKCTQIATTMPRFRPCNRIHSWDIVR